MIKDNEPVYSFLMSVYKDDNLLDKAISSLTSQRFKNWELIILDNGNSTDHIWNKISKYSRLDKRIISFRCEENVGWAKGAALCLEKAKGKYMTFLAADDFINENALDILNQVITNQDPDIIWVGIQFVTYSNGSMMIVGNNIPDDRTYTDENRSDTIIELMKKTYYNAFCHYMKIDFLKENNINFFEPYYADCGGMTKAMATAHSMVSLKDIVYNLSVSTSQTAGYYMWNSYKRIFGSQWESIREVFQKEGFSQINNIRYVAVRIQKNHLACLNALCIGKCRNEYMTNIEKNGLERLIELKETFQFMAVIEMMYYYGREAYMVEVANLMISLGNNIGLEQFQIIEQNWFWKLMNICMDYEDGLFIKAKDVREDDIEYLLEIVLDEDNVGALGYEILLAVIEKCNNDVLVTYSEKLLKVLEKFRIIISENEI